MRLLTDIRGTHATRAGMANRLSLPVGMEGLGIGDRARIIDAAAPTSSLSVFRTGRALSPVMQALAVALLNGTPAPKLGTAVLPRATLAWHLRAPPPFASKVVQGGPSCVDEPSPPPASPTPFLRSPP